MTPTPPQPAEDAAPRLSETPLVPTQQARATTEAVRWDDIEELREDPDPVHQAARATELINECRQRIIQLAALRRTAIERAHRDRGMTYADVAESLGITKGRIGQIRNGRTDEN